MTAGNTRKQALIEIWQAAIDAVSGRQAVINAIAADGPFAPDSIVAVGKAASGMCLGALESFPDAAALVVTKYDHGDPKLKDYPNLQLIESAHPIPDKNSLRAGSALLRHFDTMPADSRLLMLVSGGASALAEALPDGMSLADLQVITDEMIAGGKTIAEINARRKQTSLIKDGKLIERFYGEEIRVYAISDVEGDAIETIGSGIGDCCLAETRASSRIIASNSLARAQAARRAQELDLPVVLNEESLYGDVFDAAARIGAILADAGPGVYIWGGDRKHRRA